MIDRLNIKITLTFFLTLNLTLFAQGFVCAIGGGSENYNDWSDAPYRWIVQKADSGKIIIIDVADASSWLPNYFISLGASTAYNKTIPNVSTANLQSTYDELITAKAIFIRGGNQWDYIRFWKGTKVDSAIQYVFNNGGVIAGTSAGAAVLGEIDFSAQAGSIYPDEALQNPFNSLMRFEDNFLKLVPNVLFDTHFIERGRHGRLIGMIYNRHFNIGRDIIGAGIDDRTAICVSPDGTGEVMGSGAVTIYYKDNLTKYAPFTSGKYTIENLKSHILTRGWKFNFITKQVSFIPSSAKDFDTNRPWQFPKTNFYLTGNNNISAQLSTHLSAFLSSVNSSNILIISHPGFSNNVSTITNYLSSNNFSHSVLYLTNSNLNSQTEANKVSSSTCLVFAGDSLNILSYLNQTGNLVPDAFQSAVQAGKPIFFFGNSGKIAGEKFVGNTDSDLYASYRGRMTLNDGLNVFGDFVYQPLIFDNADYYENRMSAVLWGMMRSRKKAGLYLNGTNSVQISNAEKSISGNTTLPFLIVDAREATKVDSSTYRASSSIGPRQVVAFDNLRWSLTNYPQIRYLLEEGRFNNLTKVEEEGSISQPTDFILYQNYPNPFNLSTKISWQSPIGSWQTIKLYDIMGREIETIVNGYYEAGFHSTFFIVNSSLPSGVYFYRLTVGDFSQTKSMVLIK